MVLQSPATRRGAGVGGLPHAAVPAVVPGWSKAVKSAAVEAARSSTRGRGWAPSGPASSWECRAAQSRQARPEGHKRRARALQRQHFDRAVLLAAPAEHPQRRRRTPRRAALGAAALSHAAAVVLVAVARAGADPRAIEQQQSKVCVAAPRHVPTAGRAVLARSLPLTPARALRRCSQQHFQTPNAERTARVGVNVVQRNPNL